MPSMRLLQIQSMTLSTPLEHFSARLQAISHVYPISTLESHTVSTSGVRWGCRACDYGVVSLSFIESLKFQSIVSSLKTKYRAADYSSCFLKENKIGYLCSPLDCRNFSPQDKKCQLPPNLIILAKLWLLSTDSILYYQGVKRSSKFWLCSDDIESGGQISHKCKSSNALTCKSDEDAPHPAFCS